MKFPFNHKAFYPSQNTFKTYSFQKGSYMYILNNLSLSLSLLHTLYHLFFNDCNDNVTISAQLTLYQTIPHFHTSNMAAFRKHFGKWRNVVSHIIYLLPNNPCFFFDPKIEAIGKHCGKRRKCWSPTSILCFPTIFSTHSQHKFWNWSY